MNVPHISKLLSQRRYNKKQVLYLTKLTEEQYNNFQIDTARDFIEYFFGNILSVDELLATRSFWEWWMNKWDEADERFILPALYATDKNNKTTLYRQQHQYVFNATSTRQVYLMQDFRHMRATFESEMKQRSILNSQNLSA